MTLIECFTQSHIDNIAACLGLKPEQMVLIGNAAEMADAVKRYEKLLKQRNISTKITVCDVQRMDMDDMFAVLKKAVLAAGDCVIDLTGGDERVIMAAGAVLAVLPADVRQRIRVEKFDYATNAVLDCAHNQKSRSASVDLTVGELILLYGGTLHPKGYQPPKDCSPRDIAGLWDMVSENPKWWNQSLSLLGEFERRSESKTDVLLPLSQLRNSIPNFDAKEETIRQLLDKLHHRGVIVDKSSRNTLAYTYTSPLLRYCTQKAGNVLEIKTLLEGRAVLEDGAHYFNDCQTSVSIDWDGVVYDPVERMPETRNEIDVVLMHGTTALFISCKNGNIGEEELYKLHTVATRFGGANARKMLIATDLDQKSPAANRAFMQRAWDMNIFLVTDAAELSKDEWKEIFKNATR